MGGGFGVLVKNQNIFMETQRGIEYNVGRFFLSEIYRKTERFDLDERTRVNIGPPIICTDHNPPNMGTV